MDKTESQPTPTETNPPAPQTEPQPISVEPQTPPQDPQPESQESQPATAKPKKSHKKFILVIVIVLIILGIAGGAVALMLLQNHPSTDSDDDQSSTNPLPEQISDFDLAFLQKDAAKNQLYSPLSIKYALAMLEAGAAGDSKQQIESAIGSLTPQKYPTNKNMSFANALFVNNKLPDDTIKISYTTAIRDQFGAEVLHVPFTSATSINTWVSDKTFSLIDDLLSDEDLKPENQPEQDFVLVNALAIDMEWVNKIQSLCDDYYVSFPYINYSSSVSPFEFTGFTKQPFNNSTLEVNSLNIAATIHKYDILSDLGADNIRQTISDEYTKWLGTEEAELCAKDREYLPTVDEYTDDYMRTLGDGGYGTVKSSTDFSLYDDSEIKAFAKSLRTYDGVTLEYVGIMPKTTSLSDYLQHLTTAKLSAVISQLKPIAFDNFKNGVITHVTGNIPTFKFQDKLELVDELKGLGITDIFDEAKSDLSNLSNDPTGLRIGNAVHQTTIGFSNDGIKASAATALVGGKGAGGDCLYYHYFDVPVEKIDLTFDNPYLFLIRDKNSGTIWFIGTVYEPSPYAQPSYQ